MIVPTSTVPASVVSQPSTNGTKVVWHEPPPRAPLSRDELVLLKKQYGKIDKNSLEDIELTRDMLDQLNPTNVLAASQAR